MEWDGAGTDIPLCNVVGRRVNKIPSKAFIEEAVKNKHTQMSNFICTNTFFIQIHNLIIITHTTYTTTTTHAFPYNHSTTFSILIPHPKNHQNHSFPDRQGSSDSNSHTLDIDKANLQSPEISHQYSCKSITE